jgi:hypothetical protein
MSVKSIDGVDVGDIETEGEFESEFLRRVDLFDSLQLKLVEQLFSAYTQMVEETERSSGNDDIKK